MEWTGQQQIAMLVQSGGVGLLLGVVYDMFFAAGRRNTRPAVFIRDALFGLVAALITFFCALAITDGKMHPLLFAGSGLGMAAEHYSVGRALRWCIYTMRRNIGVGIKWLDHILYTGAKVIWSLLSKVWSAQKRFWSKSRSKNSQKRGIFEKNS